MRNLTSEKQAYLLKIIGMLFINFRELIIIQTRTVKNAYSQ